MIPALVVAVVVMLAVSTWSVVAVLDDAGEGTPAPRGQGSLEVGGVVAPQVTARLGHDRVSPMEAIAVTGRVTGALPGQALHVQQRRSSAWVSFPLRPAVSESGTFSSFVELGKPGLHRLRVLEPASGATSQTLVVRVG